MDKKNKENNKSKMVELDKIEYSGDKKAIEVYINGFKVSGTIKFEVDKSVIERKLLQGDDSIEMYKEITIRFNKGMMKKDVNIRGYIVGMEVSEWG